MLRKRRPVYLKQPLFIDTLWLYQVAAQSMGCLTSACSFIVVFSELFSWPRVAEQMSPCRWGCQVVRRCILNKKFHVTSPQSLSRQDLESKFRNLYQQRIKLPTQPRSNIFPYTLEDILAYSTRTLTEWITTTKEALVSAHLQPPQHDGIRLLITVHI